jgi:hypothetical protein
MKYVGRTNGRPYGFPQDQSTLPEYFIGELNCDIDFKL